MKSLTATPATGGGEVLEVIQKSENLFQISTTWRSSEFPKDESHNDYRNTTPCSQRKQTRRNLQPLAYDTQLLAPFVDIDYFINRWDAVRLPARISHGVYVNGPLFPRTATPAVAEQVRTCGRLPYFLLVSSEREKVKQNMRPPWWNNSTVWLGIPVKHATSVYTPSWVWLEDKTKQNKNPGYFFPPIPASELLGIIVFPSVYETESGAQCGAIRIISMIVLPEMSASDAAA